jgi:chondroitin 4-sulfotransferase 11
MLQSLNTILKRGRNLLLYGAYIPPEYFVFDERRLVYISIPKVACTSIKLAIEGVDEQIATSEQGVMGVHRKLTSKCTHSLNRHAADYTIFAFVRNPYDRLVSCYEDKVKKPVQHNGQYYFATAYNRVFLRRLLGSAFHADMSFDEFVRLVSRTPDAIADGHFKSQYSSLYRHDRRIPHIVGKFENLGEDWKPLADRFGLAALSANNRSAERAQWMDYYTSRQTIELVRKRFKNDIESFDYRASYEELISGI